MIYVFLVYVIKKSLTYFEKKNVQFLDLLLISS